MVLALIVPLILFTGCDGIAPDLGIEFKDYSAPVIINNSNLIVNNSNVSIIIDEDIYIPVENKTFTIASFNVQIFGVSKANNNYVVEALGDIIEDYDIIAFQEIRDKSEASFPQLMFRELNSYDYLVSDRLGRSTSKEQAAFIYDSSKFRNVEAVVYPDVNDVFEREPYIGYFQYGGFSFVIIQIHVKPTDAQEEIKHLEDVVEWAKQHYNDNDVFIIGDLNADCAYYKEGTELKDYYWIIPDSADTTVGKNVCAYDRIITNNDYSHMIKDWGVDRYSNDGIDDEDLISAISDHYPVYVKLEI